MVLAIIALYARDMMFMLALSLLLAPYYYNYYYFQSRLEVIFLSRFYAIVPVAHFCLEIPTANTRINDLYMLTGIMRDHRSGGEMVRRRDVRKSLLNCMYIGLPARRGVIMAGW